MPALDGVRALAILAVVAFHVDAGLLPSGTLGVEVFFVLSGFLITRLLLAEHDRTGTVDLRAFYARRARRLMPALVLLVVVQSALYGLHVGDAARALSYTDDLFLGYGAPRGSFAQTWSLGIEEQFYLVWPAVLLALIPLRRSRFAPAVGALLVLAVAVHVLLNGALPAGWVPNFLPTSRLDALLAGALLAALVRTPEGWALVARIATPTAGVAATALLAGCTLLPAAVFKGVGLITVVPPSVVLIACAADGLGRLASRPAVWIGQRSYGLYLLHLPILGELTGVHPVALRLLLTLAVSLLAADLSYRFLEQPILRASRRPREKPVAAGRLAA